MRKLTAKILSLVFILNTFIMGIGGIIVSADDNAPFNFKWESGRVLDSMLNIQEKGTAYDDVFVWWDFGSRNGSLFDVGTYDLSYNLDGKRIDFKVEKSGSKAVVTYNIWDYSKGSYMSVNDSGMLFEVYRDTLGAYILPTLSSYPPIADTYKINYNENGEAESASFTIRKDTGFAFKLDNKDVKFKWTSNDIFYFSTNGMTQGNIYDFDLKLNIPGESEIKQNLEIFTGINAASVTSSPYANNGKGIRDVVDHSSRPYPDADPGTDPELELSFDLPKVWDSSQNKYVFVNPSSVSEDDIASIVLNMGNASDKRKIQINISNIYASDLKSATSITNANGAVIKSVSRDSSNQRIRIRLSNLEPGIIYNPTEISMYKPNNPDFLSYATSIEHGKVYTFVQYNVEAIASDEYYVRIKPYEGYRGYYVIYMGDTSSTLAQWSQVEDTKGGTEDIYVPVNINSDNMQTKYFRVEFRFTPPDATPGSSQITVQSQILKYTPSEDDIIISTPQNLTVVDSKVVNSLTDPSKQELVLTLKWDMCYEKVLKNILAKNGNKLDINYVFNRGVIPYDDFEDVFADVKVHASLSGDNIEITVTDDEGKVEKFETIITETTINSTLHNIISPQVTFRLPCAPKATGNTIFLYPNVYFLNVSGSYYDSNSSSTINIPASLPAYLTLDGVDSASVPQPQNIKVVKEGEDTVTERSFTVVWDTLSPSSDGPMSHYIETMLESRGLTVGEDSIKYNAYIAQDKELIDKLINYSGKREDMYKELSIARYDNENKSGINPIDVLAIADNEISIRDNLRDKKIVSIDNILQDVNLLQQKLKFNGLDTNQNYYVVVETVVVPYQEKDDTHEGGYLEEETQYSDVSVIVSATTLPPYDEPNEDEKNPAAPENFDKKDITLNSVNLYWDRVKESEEDVLEYQFIRISGAQMSEADMGTRDEYGEVYSKLSQSYKIAGWQTGESNIYPYEQNAFSQTPAEDTKFEYDISDAVINSLIDKTLNPNQLYFYYIRTVRLVEGKPKAYSVWVPLSVTTTPVSAPYNLKVERDIEHNKKSQIVVSFDTPYFDIEKLGTDYILQYSLKEDSADWSQAERMNAGSLKGSYSTNQDGSLHFIYNIGGLKSGTLYSIKVRLFDSILNEPSVYSNIVQMRTEVDPDDNKNDEDTNDWIDHYKKMLEELLKKPYWVIEDSVTKSIIYYRPQYFKDLLASETSATLTLASTEEGDNGFRKLYYIPASAIKEAYDANKGFKITWGDMDVIISPRAIDVDVDQEVRKVLERIDENFIDDYFIRISASFNEVSYTIDGNNPLSPIADISIEAIGSDEKINLWDDKMVEMLKSMIESDLEDAKREIKNEIKDESTSEELIKELKDMFEDFEEDFGEELDEELEDIVDRTYSITELKGNLIVAYPVEATSSVSGYRQGSGIWTTVNAMDYMGKKGIYSTLTGVFVFAGRTINIPGINEVPNGTPITNLVSKFGLDDYLGKSNTMNLSAPLTRSMAIGCAARLAGAPRTTDPTAFFASKGIILSTRATQEPITVQEAIYLTMMAYQARTNTKVETMQIRNYTLTSGINGIQTNYKKSVQAAFEIGIYSNTGMNPNSNITVSEFLQMLINMAAKTKLL